MALVKMAEEFGGLPMESLIGGPLQAACDAQTLSLIHISEPTRRS